MRFLHTRDPALLVEPLRADDETPDDVLVAQAQQDPRRFASLYSRYFAAIYGYCFTELRDPEGAADAASQTFLQALSALDRYRANNRFRAWIFTIAHNVLLDARRREHPITSITIETALVDPSPRPEEYALMRLEVERLDAALARLPDEDRRVLELRRAGLRGQDIGEVLGIGHAAARQRQVRALDRLRLVLNAPVGLDVNEADRDA